MNYSKITLLFKSKNKPPYFIGSQMRGAFGYALKKVTCINPSYSCEGCFASANCLYYEFYEEKNSFHRYRFDFELGRELYDFNIYLFDSACTKLPYVVSALHMMLTQIGLGKEREIYKNFDIFINDVKCFEYAKLSLPKEFIKKLQIDGSRPDITLQLLTPLRIKKENTFVRDDQIELSDIINSIYQRQMKLLGREYKRFPYPIEGEIIQKELKFVELTRQSNRQKTTMSMGGIMGQIKIKNLNKECYEVIKVGELIGVGKQTVFGLGKLKVTPNEGGESE